MGNSDNHKTTDLIPRHSEVSSELEQHKCVVKYMKGNSKKIKNKSSYNM